VPQQPVINFCFAYNYSQSLGKESSQLTRG
jgi:hypothetical protein